MAKKKILPLVLLSVVVLAVIGIWGMKIYGNYAALRTVLEQLRNSAGAGDVLGVWDIPEKQLEKYVVGKRVELNALHPAGDARRQGCEYILSKGEVASVELQDTGYVQIYAKGDWFLYESCLKEGQWKITQYGTISGLQSMSYSMVSETGCFIMIDGGYDVDAPEISRLAEVFGNKVDLWICSHFHSDHIGGITELLKNPGELQIGEIWYPPVDFETYLTFAKEWDTIDTCEAFLNEIKGMDNVQTVSNGESKSFGGLEFFFLSAYTEGQPWTYEGNNCGFVFRVKGDEETMLFCCDAGNEWMSQVLMDCYGDLLKCDYLQMGHHGNGGLTAEAYQMTRPKVAFFDGPGWLFEDRERYTAAQNRELMESMGSEIYLLDEAPNAIILK